MLLAPTEVKFLSLLPTFMRNYKAELFISKIVHNFSSSNSIFIPDKHFKNEFYVELFDIIDEKNDSVFTFQMSIYKGITNHIYYDTLEKNPTTIEMIFFSKDPSKIPLSIKYKNNFLSNFDNNNNTCRTRFCLAHINPNELQYLNSEDFMKNNFKFDNNSYQAIIRFAQDNTIKYSIAPFKIESKKYFDEEKIVQKEDYELLEGFCSNYLKFLNNLCDLKNNQKLNEETLNEFSSDLESLKNNYMQIEKTGLFQFLSNPSDIDHISDSLELIYNNNLLSEFIAIYKQKNNVMDFSGCASYAIETHEFYYKFYKKIAGDKNLNKSEKIKLLEAGSIICIKVILLKSSIKGIDYINIESAGKSNPYYMAAELLLEIIKNLNENSRLFETFLYFNSGCIFNYLEKDNKMKYYAKNVFDRVVEIETYNYKTEFGLSLLNIEQIKNHLMQLVPKTIIRVETGIEFRAYFEKETRVMIINELAMFYETIDNLNVLYKKEGAKKYVIPIMMELLHEMLCHGKVRFLNDDEKSPRFFRDSNNNFDYKSILRECKLENNSYAKLPVPESGRILESFISENVNVINSLKSPIDNNIQLIDYKLWIGPTFEELEKKVVQTQSYGKNIGKAMLTDEFDDFDYDDCYVDRGKKIKF